MTLQHRTHILFAGLLWSALLLAAPPAANAGLILGPPMYLGLQSGLVGYWTFDGMDVAQNSSGKLMVYDRSGSGNSASSTRQGAAGISPFPTSGKIGQGANFTQTSGQYLDAGHPSAYVSMPKLTASAWVYPRSAGLSNNGIFLAKGYGLQSSLTLGWVTGFDSFDGVRNEFYFEVDCPTTNLKVRSSQNVFKYNEWQFMTITWDGSQNASGVHLYRNGVEVSYDQQTDGGGAPQDDTSQDLIIGNTNDGLETFDGKIDDVRIYNRVLTPDEIKRLNNIGGTLHFGRPNSTGSLSQGLVGWWTFDGADMSGVMAYDRSGNGAHGTLAAGPSRTIGKIGQALDFHSENNGVTYGEPASLTNLQSMSISAWIKLDSFPTCGGNPDIIEKGGGGSAGWSFWLDCATPNGLSFIRYMTGSAIQSITSVDSITVGQWQHVLVTYASSTAAANIHIYVNGVETTYSTTNNGTGGNIDDTGNNGNISNGVDGRIDDVRVYNRVLTPDEIKRLYKMGSTLKQGVASSNDSLSLGLVAYWPFDGKTLAKNNSGNLTAFDQSGNGDNGTSTNAAGAATITPGKIGQGLNFDGSNDLFMVGQPANLKITGSMSISAWAYPKALVSGSNQPIINKIGANGDRGWGLLLNDDQGTYNFFMIGYVDGTDATGEFGRYTNTAIVTGRWYHVVGVYDASAQTVDIYLNGVKDNGAAGTAGVPASQFNSNMAVAIGDEPAGPYFYTGIIDDLRVYNRALTKDEVKRLYNMGR